MIRLSATRTSPQGLARLRDSGQTSLWFDNQAEDAARFYVVEIMNHPDSAKRVRVFRAMMEMVKPDIAALQRAVE